MFNVDDLLMPALVSSVLGGGFALMLILSAHDSNPPMPTRMAAAEQSVRDQARDVVRPGVRPNNGRPSGGR